KNMKFALINPQVPQYSYDGTYLGWDVVSTDIRTFEVCPPLFWVDCLDEVEQNTFYYDENTQTIKPIPEPPAIPSA
ncbi:MAG: hypothetical protein ACKOZX_05175, partial [Gammaproteobacteria bacterium]